jgi:hypothetical protein
MTEEIGGFEIIEQAALQMLGAPDEGALLELYRAQSRVCLLGRGVEPEEAAELADKFAEIILHRRREIALSAGSNTSEVLQ